MDLFGFLRVDSIFNAIPCIEMITALKVSELICDRYYYAINDKFVVHISLHYSSFVSLVCTRF